MIRLGIDLGGTKIEGVVLDDDGQTRFRDRIPTEQNRGYDHILTNIRLFYDRMRGEIGGKAHTIGFGTPGAVSPKTGLMKNSNTNCLNGRPLKDDLERILSRPIGLQNDANCFAMAEALQGAAVGKAVVFGVIMGTGCGGGIVCSGQPVVGPQAIAGEWGHMTIDPAGPECWCGSKGCVERYISGGGLSEQYLALTGERKFAEEIVQDWRRGSLQAGAVMETFFDAFGRAMANMINLLDPDMVVLGGGLSNIEELYVRGYEHVRRYVFSDHFETPIVKHKLGDSAGVLGAAWIGK